MISKAVYIDTNFYTWVPESLLISLHYEHIYSTWSSIEWALIISWDSSNKIICCIYHFCE